MTEQDTVDRPAVDADDAAVAPDAMVEVAPTQELTPGGVITRRSAAPFEVHLDVFSGPFDLLLGLKASRLLPQSGPQDDEDLALIEARDLLFARLLQYRAYKDIAATFRERMATAGRITPRQAGLEPEFASLLPELVIAITPEQFAMIAARTMTPKIAPTVGLDHLHAPQVSVGEQAALIVERLRSRGQVSFRSLVADAESTLVIVARFLALLELFKEAAIAFEQAEALGELDIRWTGTEAGDIAIDDEFDEDGDDSDDGDGSDGGVPHATSEPREIDETGGAAAPRTGADDE